MIYGNIKISKKKLFQCKQQSERVVALTSNYETKKNNEKRKLTTVRVKRVHCDGRKKTHRERMTKNKMMTKNLKMDKIE